MDSFPGGVVFLFILGRFNLAKSHVSFRDISILPSL